MRRLLPLLLLTLAGCATSVPFDRTARAELDAFVGASPREAYQRYGAPVRETSDGGSGRIVRWEWTRTSEVPGTTLATATTGTGSDGSSTLSQTIVDFSSERSTDVRFVELYVGADGSVYRHRSNLRSAAEERAVLTRRLLWVGGITTAVLVGGALTCATTC